MSRLCFAATLAVGLGADAAVPAYLRPHLVNYYTFDNPLTRGGTVEDDLGLDATPIDIVNGAPRVTDTPWAGSQYSLETGQRNTGDNDDWKAGIQFDSSAESTLTGTAGVSGVTIAGWFKPLGDEDNNPSPNTNTGFPFDTFNAFGLAGWLRGDDDGANIDGHGVRALIEVINGRVTALARRLDDQGSGRRASVQPWHEDLPPEEWTHLAATFDFDQGDIALFRNGLLIEMEDADVGAWDLTEELDFTSFTNAGGIKIGGSHPGNSSEQNPFNGRIDELTFFNRELDPREVQELYYGLKFTPGDFNRDGVVDAADYTVWRDANGSTDDLATDANGDGLTDSADLELWGDFYGYGPTPPLFAVPEPAAGVAALPALLGLLRRRS